MNQKPLTDEEQELDLQNLDAVFKERLTHDAGFMYSRRPIEWNTHTPEEREQLFEELWKMVRHTASSPQETSRDLPH